MLGIERRLGEPEIMTRHIQNTLLLLRYQKADTHILVDVKSTSYLIYLGLGSYCLTLKPRALIVHKFGVVSSCVMISGIIVSRMLSKIAEKYRNH